MNTNTHTKTLILGTRGSRLALIQTEKVRSMLLRAIPDIEITIKVIKTEGDSDLSIPLSSFGGRGAFVRSIEHSLLRNDIDAAVHSLKDLPSQLPEGLVLGSVPEREDPRDALVSSNGHTLEALPAGSVIATGSERRRVQISEKRPDIRFIDIRGNVETRLRKLDSEDIDAVVLAAAGMLRLGLKSRITQYIEIETCLPAPCQGALGLECRDDDSDTLSMLEHIDDSDAHICVDAERIFIATLGMGCHTPVGALARFTGEEIEFCGFAYDEIKDTVIRKTVSADKNTIEVVSEKMAHQFISQLTEVGLEK